MNAIHRFQRLHLPAKPWLVLSLVLVGIVILAAAGAGLARMSTKPSAQASPIHPTFALLDEKSQPVKESGQPVSTQKTCGQCHDTDYISSHNSHADLGLSAVAGSGNPISGHSWDTGNGAFDSWNALTYHYLSLNQEERPDLGTEDWMRTFGARHVGGGPAGEFVETNCFLCHLSNPDNAARIAALQAGQFEWANTATLLATQIVTQTNGVFTWNPGAFDEQGKLNENFVTIQDPTNQNCAQCHGLVHSGKTPVQISGCELDNWETATTGQVISDQKISNSGANISGKDEIARSWDIHAERGVKCIECHFSQNNPAYSEINAGAEPQHLVFDPRRLDIGEYLQRPSHNLARMQADPASTNQSGQDSCTACHDPQPDHTWLPYVDRHMQELSCQTCHIPKMNAPAVESYDWTVLTKAGEPNKACRGVSSDSSGKDRLITGFQPSLLARKDGDGTTQLAPYNLVSSWYWVYDGPDGTQPVRLADLKAAWFEGADYAPDVLKVFDNNADGLLTASELRLDSPEKQDLISSRLADLGLNNPHIVGEVQPYGIDHGVTRGEYVTRECKSCHSNDSILTQSIHLADYVPGGVLPEFVSDGRTVPAGDLHLDGQALDYQPSLAKQGRYVFGHNRVPWLDWLGALFFAAVIAGVAGHGTLRFVSTLRKPHTSPETRKVYMYSVYERFWHWLQTSTIVLLLFSGLIIHRPDIFGIFSFRYVVDIHNVLAAILVINAGLSLFYHLASGEIRQYIPRPYGFFDQAILQAKFYLKGIFKGEPHPFEKIPERKLNPLQQATYFAILNVLLPLQILSGALMWGAQRWPQLAGWLGGLPVLAPIHSLVAWLFAAFIVAHVYLTTTGHEPLSGIQAMIQGWEDVESQPKPHRSKKK